MPQLNLKPNHKVIQDYYATLQQYDQHAITHEGAVSNPLAKNFWGFAEAGKQLADLHVNYESAPKYDKLKPIETPGMQIDWHVEKMKLSKNKTQLIYNDFLTLNGIPPEVHDYRLGTRSALEWIVDKYRVKTDRRSGIVNDPNRETEPRYIVDLITRVITISLKTVEIIKNLPPL